MSNSDWLKSDWLKIILHKNQIEELQKYLCKYFDELSWVSEDLGDYVLWNFYCSEQRITRLVVLISSYQAMKGDNSFIKIDRMGGIN